MSTLDTWSYLGKPDDTGISLKSIVHNNLVRAARLPEPPTVIHLVCLAASSSLSMCLRTTSSSAVIVRFADSTASRAVRGSGLKLVTWDIISGEISCIRFGVEQVRVTDRGR